MAVEMERSGEAGYRGKVAAQVDRMQVDLGTILVQMTAEVVEVEKFGLVSGSVFFDNLMNFMDLCPEKCIYIHNFVHLV